MANNLVITFSLEPPGTNYAKVVMEIHSLGRYHQIQDLTYCVHSSLDATQAAKQIGRWLEKRDRLFVIQASHMAGYEWGSVVEDFFQQWWATST